MVELKTKVRVATVCFCGGAIHPQHNNNTNTTTTTTTVRQHHNHHHHHHRHHLRHRHHNINHHAPPPPPPPPPSPPQQQGKMASAPHASRIARKYRRSRLKRVKRQEFKKLRDMVPALQEKPVVTKVEVIEEAIKYIDELHTALIERFRTRGLPSTLRGMLASNAESRTAPDLPLEPREVHGGNIRELVRHLLATSSPSALPPARLENARTLPSFIQRVAKARRL